MFSVCVFLFACLLGTISNNYDCASISDQNDCGDVPWCVYDSSGATCKKDQCLRKAAAGEDCGSGCVLYEGGCHTPDEYFCRASTNWGADYDYCFDRYLSAETCLPNNDGFCLPCVTLTSSYGDYCSFNYSVDAFCGVIPVQNCSQFPFCKVDGGTCISVSCADFADECEAGCTVHSFPRPYKNENGEVYEGAINYCTDTQSSPNKCFWLTYTAIEGERSCKDHEGCSYVYIPMGNGGEYMCVENSQSENSSLLVSGKFGSLMLLIALFFFLILN